MSNMKHKVLLFASLLLSSPAWSAQITVSMINIGAVQPQPNFFVFDINGVIRDLLCDQFVPNVTSERYTAKVATLDDLTDTALIRQGDSTALARQKYTWIAILDTLAYGNAALAPDVTRANRFIVDGSGPMTTLSTQLLEFAQMANPANFNLTGFQIFVPIRNDGSIFPTQEQTGIDNGGGGGGQGQVPEPTTAFLVSGGIGGILAWGIRRRRS